MISVERLEKVHDHLVDLDSRQSGTVLTKRIHDARDWVREEINTQHLILSLDKWLSDEDGVKDES